MARGESIITDMDSTNNQEHIALLRKYYEYDEETRTFTVPVTYSKASEILDDNVRDFKHHPRFKKEALEEISDILHSLPSSTKADVHLLIEDYEGIEPSVLLSSFNEAILLNQHRSRLEQRKSGFTAAILAIVGMIILFFYVFGKIHNWYGSGEGTLGYDFATEVLNVVAWVFLWEAVTVLFLNPNDYRSMNAGLFLKINELGFYDASGKKKFVEEDIKQRFDYSLKLRRWEPTGRYLLLIGATAMTIYGAFLTFNSGFALAQASSITEGYNLYVTVNTLGEALGILFAICGIAGMAFFMERISLGKAFTVLTIIMGVLILAYFIIALIAQGVSNNLSSVGFCAIIYLVYLPGYLIMALARARTQKTLDSITKD